MQLLHVPAHQLRQGESPGQQSFASSRGNGGQLTAASPGTFPTRRWRRIAEEASSSRASSCCHAWGRRVFRRQPAPPCASWSCQTLMPRRVSGSVACVVTARQRSQPPGKLGSQNQVEATLRTSGGGSSIRRAQERRVQAVASWSGRIEAKKAAVRRTCAEEGTDLIRKQGMALRSRSHDDATPQLNFFARRLSIPRAQLFRRLAHVSPGSQVLSVHCCRTCKLSIASAASLSVNRRLRRLTAAFAFVMAVY